MNQLVNRRRILLAGAGAAAAALLPELRAAEAQRAGPKPVMVKVPGNADIQKALATSKVGISEATHRAHLTLWQGYAKKVNEIRGLLAQLDTSASKGNQIYSDTRALKVNYAFALGGYKNHNVYFDALGGAGGPATGDVATLINDAYGSFEKWSADMKITGLSGRGWAFLGYDRDEQRVFNFIGDAQDSFPAWNCELLLALDVYEHAYYLDFQTSRAKYIDAWLKTIDWDVVDKRLKR